MKRAVTFCLIGVGFLATFAGSCDENHVDAHRSTKVDKRGAEVYAMPDEFPNIATKCVGHGYRAYVTTHSKDDTQPVLVKDSNCE
jgi:hypothetical protein